MEAAGEIAVALIRDLDAIRDAEALGGGWSYDCPCEDCQVNLCVLTLTIKRDSIFEWEKPDAVPIKTEPAAAHSPAVRPSR